MKLFWILFFIFTSSYYSYAQDYILGKERKEWGVAIPVPEDSPIQFRIGTRFQAIAKHQEKIGATDADSDLQLQDAFIRRTRFQVEASYKEDFRFYMDIRNDKANKEDKGEKDFNVGDAYFEVANVFGQEKLKFRFLRAKVDVSRSQTVSSSKLIFLERAHIAEEASDFVNQNRRATNVQLLGFYDYFYFQLVAGDGVYSGDLTDANGDEADSITAQNFMIGTKLRIYPFKGWEDKKVRDTYFGKGKHFSFGGGVFQTSNIKFTDGLSNDNEITRTLWNGEISFHYKSLLLQGEYFRFEGAIEDMSATSLNYGSSDGFYLEGEYVFTSLSYLAPYFRYEEWDRFHQADNFSLTSTVFGLNWYMKGHNIRLGLFYDLTKRDSNLIETGFDGNNYRNTQSLLLTSMIYY